MLCQHPSQRTDLQANNLQGRGICEQVRIGKDNGLLVLLVYVNVCLTAKFLREFCLNSGAKLLLKENLHPCIGFFVERILLGVGALFLWLVGFPAFVTAHALIQILLATIESALLSALFIPFAQYPVVQEMTYLIISVGLLLAISFMAAVVGVHVLIRRNNFLAVSFSSVLLITFAGAFYPIDSLPTWAATIAAYNPITYLVDIIRAALFGIEPLLALPLEIGICIAFLVGLIITAFCVAHCPFDTSNVQNV